MFRDLLKRNLKGTWKGYIDLVKPSYGTRAYLRDHAPSRQDIENIKERSLILFIKNIDETYTIAYVDKDGDYQVRSMRMRSIINQLNRYQVHLNPRLENNAITPDIIDKINNWLEEHHSHHMVQTTYSADPTGWTVFGTCIIAVVGFISVPFIAGIKSLMDWATRKPMTENKSTLAADHITAMSDHAFVGLSNKITQKYDQTCTTSNSSRKMIKQLKGQNHDGHIPQNITQDKIALINYMKDPKNNGKKLFCTVAKLVDPLEPEAHAPAARRFV